MRKEDVLYLMSLGCEHKTLLVIYLVDLKKAVDYKASQGKRGKRNPTVYEFVSWGFARGTVYAAAKKAGMKVTEGVIYGI